MANSGIHCQLWMGGLEPYMTESFIVSAFQRMGESPISVKVMRNKYSGEAAGYCFVHFQTDEEAVNAMHKLNGKVIPNTQPPLRFRLNNASSSSRINVSDRDFSLWVGDLSPDVDDYGLYKTFASRYESIRTAKVIMDNSGFSKGYGFIRFASEEEQKHCLAHMNGFKGLGSKTLKISTAVPKGHRQSNTPLTMSGGYSSSQDYTQYYDTTAYWQSYSAWQAYYEDPTAALAQTIENTAQQEQAEASATQEDDLELIEHNIALDIESCNREIMERDYNLWDALESSKWLPVDCVETHG